MSSLSSRGAPRLHAAVVVFAAAALTAAAPAHAASSRSKAGVPRGASIVEANAQATVLAIDRDDQFTLYGCRAPAPSAARSRRGSTAAAAAGTSRRRACGSPAASRPSGPGYEQGSLALSVGGRRVYWTRGGVARSAPLP